jgi:drug/metabolite transporter (DMT)-like permease
MLGVAALYSLTSVMGKGAMQYAPPESFGAFYFLLLGAVSLVVIGAHRPSSVAALWRNPLGSLLVALCTAVMVVSHFLALSEVQAAYMIAVKRTSLLFGILYGAWLFKEPGLPRQLVAGILMLAGVFLIAS